MHLFVAAGIFHPDAGGPATHLRDLLPEIQARGHQVRVLAYGDAPFTGYPYPLVRIARGPLPVRLARYAAAYRRGARWADVVYVTSLALPRRLGWPSPVVLRVAGDHTWERCIRRRLVPSTEDVDAFQHARHGPLVSALRRAQALEARRADRIVVPSRYLRDMVLGWGAPSNRILVVPNAIPPVRGAVLPRRDEARRRLGWAAEGRYLLTIARLTPWKGVDLTIDALTRVPGVTLIVAGDGPERTALESRAAARGAEVRFIGEIAREDLAPYLCASDYVVLYSGYEGFSHTMLEALHAGTPVIASRRGGNPEVVTHGENGLLVDHPDVDALVAALTGAFVGDTHARLAAGAERSRARYPWDDQVRALLGTFEALALPQAGQDPCES